MGRIYLRSSTALGALILTIAGVATRAGDLMVSTAITTPVATATASSNTPGNITVASGGSIAVTSATAATINSSNTLSNAGAIGSTAATGAAGILINGAGGIVTTVTNTGSITAGATGATGATGILVTGDPVTGSIVSGPASTIAVTGDSATGASLASAFTGDVTIRSVTLSGSNSTALSVTGPLTGNLTLAGSSVSTGAGGTGILVAAPVSGTVSNAGTVSVGTAATVDSSNNTVAPLNPVAGLRIAASVGGGILNDRLYVDANGAVVPPASVDTTTNTLVTGTILSLGSGPAVWIAPDAASSQAVTLGAVGNGDDAYAYVNRGTVRTTAGSSGTATVAVQIGGGGADTTLQGGVNNQTSGAITAASLNANAIAVDVLAGGVVPVLRNQGSIGSTAAISAASGSTAAGPGGTGTGIVIEAGASLPSIVNTGTITAGGAGVGNGATAIVDRSGTLASIVNSGTITATTTGSGAIRSIDLTAGNGPVTVSNTGTINGGIAFGGGATALALGTGSAINGAIAFGSGNSLLTMNGTASYAGAITSGVPIAVALTDTAKLDLTKSAIAFGSLSLSGSSVLVAPVGPANGPVTVTGAASFTQSSVIQLSLQSLAASQTLTVVQAAGGVTTDHLATLIDASTAPYLFTATAPTISPTTIGIMLTRKTADQIGLTGSQAALFNQSIAALATASPEATAIANLPSQAAVVSAYNQVLPPSAGRGQLRVAQSVADTGFGAAADRLSSVYDQHRGAEPGVGAWAQELGNFVSQSADANERAFSAAGFGLAAGIDAPLLGLDAAGVALLLNGTTLRQTVGAGVSRLKTNITTQGAEPYLSWSWRSLFVQASGLAAYVKYSDNRTATFGTLSDTINSHWTGTQFGAGVTIGAHADLGRLRITPSNAFYWTSLTQHGYTEQGGGPLALIVDRQKDDLTSDTARLSLAYLLPFKDGTLRFEAHGGYEHQFKNDPTMTTATFVGGGTAVTLPGDIVRADMKSAGGGIGFVEDGVALRLAYDRRQSTGFHDQSVAVTAGMVF